jgi:hypothetical protein
MTDCWWAQTLGEAPLLTIYPLINFKPIACHTWSLYIVPAAWFVALPSAFIQFIKPSLHIKMGKLILFPKARKWPNRYRRILVIGDIAQIYAFDQELHLAICITWMWWRNERRGPSLVRDTHAWRTVQALHHCCAVFLTGFVRQVLSHTTVIKRVLVANVC